MTVQPTRFLSFNIIFQFQTVRIKVARPVTLKILAIWWFPLIQRNTCYFYSGYKNESQILLISSCSSSLRCMELYMYILNIRIVWKLHLELKKFIAPLLQLNFMSIYRILLKITEVHQCCISYFSQNSLYSEIQNQNNDHSQSKLL